MNSSTSSPKIVPSSNPSTLTIRELYARLYDLRKVCDLETPTNITDIIKYEEPRKVRFTIKNETRQ
jgi:hypothetical protein